MKKILIITGIILMNGFLFSCSDSDNLDPTLYQQSIETQATGGEEEYISPPPPPPPTGN